MSIRGTGIKILLAAFIILSVLLIPASAASVYERIESGNGYMINNICIDVTVGVNETEVNDSSAVISVYEWKNNAWTLVNITGTNRLYQNDSLNFSATDGSYTVTVLDFSSSGRGSVRLEMWTSANVTNNATIQGGHKNAEGVGDVKLKITKTVSSQSINIDDVVVVTVYIENTGQYDATNVTLNDPFQEKFLVSSIIMNNTPQTINKGKNETVLVYQLKATEPGSFTLTKATGSATNKVGSRYNFTQENAPRVEVIEVMALETSNQLNGTMVDYYTQSKLQGTITIRNTGTKPMENVHINFPIPPNVKLNGTDFTDVNESRKIVEIDKIMPNNEKIISYTITATEPANYSITPEISYIYNGSIKSGAIEPIKFRAVANPKIETLLSIWYLFLIPIVLIIAAAIFIWKRHREYKY
jgi:uncharacterized repeat protein (TIGR01451 family)